MTTADLSDCVDVCLCTRTEVRERTIRGGSTQHVHQCLDCGDRVGKAIKKSGTPPMFDEDFFDINVRKKQSQYEQKQAEEKQQKETENSTWKTAYNAYLESQQWKMLRSKVLQRDRFVCQGCFDEPATEVHHKTYANAFKEFAFELTSLCIKCHDRIHNKE